jgi:chorismate dehydratase
MKRMNRPIRVGQNLYTNAWPVYYHMPVERLKGKVEWIEQVPSRLNRALAQGEIDAGMISSFAYGESFPQYVLLPELSVSAYGSVGSVLLFHKEPLERVANGRIALASTSATSVNLLKIILQKFYGGRPIYTYAAPHLEEMMEGRDAALLIGDDAIRASWANRRYRVTDLGEQWLRWTGEWMTFAVWAVRKDALKRHADTVAELLAAFLESKRQSKLHPEPVAREAAARIGGTEPFWRRYFGGLCHDFGSEQRRGLQTYFRYARELGLLDHDVTIELWTDRPTERANRPATLG